MDDFQIQMAPKGKPTVPLGYCMKVGRYLHYFQNLETTDAFLQIPDTYVKSSGDSSWDWTVGKPWKVPGGREENIANLKKHLSEGIAVPEVIKEFDRMKAKLSSDLLDNPFAPAKRIRTRGVDGDEVLVDRALLMEPDCFEKRSPGRKRNTVSLAIPGTVSASKGYSVFVEKVVLATLLTDALEERGYQVRVIMSYNVYGIGNTAQCIWFTLKDFSEPVDVNRLLSAATPGALRFYCFGWNDDINENWGKRIVGSGYGQPKEPNKVEMAEMGANILLNSGDYGVSTKTFQDYSGRVIRFLDGENS